MKTKIIPFDLETAKKIQAGEIGGKIIDDFGNEGSIITFNGHNTPLPIVVIFRFSMGDNIHYVGNDDKPEHIKLLIEVPNEEQQFKPFDKVLVREGNNFKWCLAFYAYYVYKVKLHEMVGGSRWNQCILYEGNENLLGTTDKPKEG